MKYRILLITLPACFCFPLGAQEMPVLEEVDRLHQLEESFYYEANANLEQKEDRREGRVERIEQLDRITTQFLPARDP